MIAQEQIRSTNDHHRMGASVTAPRDFLTYSAGHWKRILLFAVGGSVLLFLFSYTRPQTFVATATVLPPEHEGMGGLLTYLSSSASSAALNLLGGTLGASPTLELFKTIVESHTVAEDVASDSVVHAFFYRRDTSQKGIVAQLNGSVLGNAERTGTLTITVQLSAPRFASARELDSTRKMAAYVANKFVDALDRFNRDRLITTAKETKIFVEQEYNNKMTDLDSAYARLQAFQEKHQAISLTDQLAATVSAAAKLASQMQQNEMQRSVESRELGPNDPRIQALTAEYEAEQAELNKYDSGGAGEYIVALKNAPELARELAGYMREVKVLEQVTGYLRGELEQQRIAERRDLPSLQMLDAARPPNGPSSPNRKLFAILGLILGLGLSLGYTVVERFYRDVRARPLAHYRLINVLASLRYGTHAPLLAPMDPQATPGIVKTPDTQEHEVKS